MSIGIAYLGVFFGAGLCLIGGALGISKLAARPSKAARVSPEAIDKLQVMMIIPAAMIEGLGLLALVIAFLAVGALKSARSRPTESAPAAAEAK